MNKLLSVIIPTKNRQKYCLEAVRQILSLGIAEIEVIIQDNSDSDELRSKITDFNNNNLVYNYYPGVLSFVDNFSIPLDLVSGEFVCFIGDDDGLLPNIVDEVLNAKMNNYDAVVPGLNACYFWPSNSPIVKNGEHGYLCLIDSKRKVKELNVQKGLSDLMKSAGQGYQKLDLPRIYHGIVKMDCVRKVKELTGSYFCGLSPDIYMAVALSFTCKKVIRLFYPITVSGICPRSGSAASATGKHTGSLKDAPHFRGHESYEWDIKSPEIYSVESIWAETVLQALRRFRAENYYSRFNVKLLDSLCLAHYPQFSKIIVDHAEKFGVDKYQLILLYMKYNTCAFIDRVYHFVIRSKNDKMKFYNVKNIEAACAIIFAELDSRK